MLKEIKEHLNKWKESCVHRLEDLMLLRWQYYPNRHIDSMKSLVKSQGCVVVVVVCKNEKSILNFIWKFQRIQNNQNNLEKEEQSGGFTLPDFKTYYKDRVIKTKVLV